MAKVSLFSGLPTDPKYAYLGSVGRFTLFSGLLRDPKGKVFFVFRSAHRF